MDRGNDSDRVFLMEETVVGATEGGTEGVRWVWSVWRKGRMFEDSIQGIVNWTTYHLHM